LLVNLSSDSETPLIRTFRQQRSIRQPTKVEGFGFWSGQDVSVEFRPAPVDTGVVFVRGDIGESARIPALVQYRVQAPRRTNLVYNGISVEMVEHIMAALAGLQIDNCEVWVDASEMPGCDGSSLSFTSALQQAEVVEQTGWCRRLIINETTRVGTDEEWVEASPAKSDALSVQYRLEYKECAAIGKQTYEGVVNPESFQRDLAPARTFMLKPEAEWLRSQGLGTRVTFNEVLVYDGNGPIDTMLRFRDECVRHKTLDLIGDLSLSGCDIVGHIVAHRSGHRLNADLVRILLTEGSILENTRKTA